MIPLTFVPPRPVEVWCPPGSDRPAGLRWRGRILPVAVVEASWRWNEGWWRDGEAADRAYHRLRTRDGLRCVVYRDQIAGRWYLEAILD